MSENETPTTGAGTIPRFKVWSQLSDDYSHSELSSNFDHIAGLLGYPSGGSAWPALEGSNAGIFGVTEMARRERTPLGAIQDLWIPWNASTPLSTISSYISGTLNTTGWFVCDGSTIAPWNGTTGHMFDYVHGSSIQLPNLLNQYRIGANPGAAPGSGGSSIVNNPAAAPGLGLSPSSAHGSNVSTAGTNNNSVSATILDHYHEHDHVHQVPTINAITTSSNGVGVTSNDTDIGINVKLSSPGAGVFTAASQGHAHNVGASATTNGIYTSNLSDINEQNTAGSSTGTYTDVTELDNRPLSMACIPIIKIFYIQAYTANPYSFTGTGAI